MSDVEYYDIIIEAVEVGTATGILTRGSAPLTIQAIYKSMASKYVFGRARWFDFTKKDAFYFDIDMKKGREGVFKPLAKGDIGYAYRLDSIVIALENNAEIPYDAVKIGEVTENLEMFKQIKNGTSIKMKLK
ncbi:MAG: hypothetical protein ACTSWN_10360 [Promethearchaeota archaeon]